MALLPHYYCKHKNSEFDHLLNYIVPVQVCVLLTGNIWRTDFGRRLSNPLSWTRNVHGEENGETSGGSRGETNRRSSATDACLAKTEIVKITPRSNRMTIYWGVKTYKEEIWIRWDVELSSTHQHHKYTISKSCVLPDRSIKTFREQQQMFLVFASWIT